MMIYSAVTIHIDIPGLRCSYSVLSLLILIKLKLTQTG